MIVLLDTDILIDVALGREPFAEYSSAVIDNAEQRRFRAFIAWHSISNFYYLVSSNSSKVNARLFIKDLMGFVSVAPTTTRDVFYALSLKLADLEDALQVAAARASHAELIITRNTRHYQNSPVPAGTPDTFIRELTS